MGRLETEFGGGIDGVGDELHKKERKAGININVSFLARVTGWMEGPFPKLGKTRGGCTWQIKVHLYTSERFLDFCEMSTLRLRVGYMRLESRREV